MEDLLTSTWSLPFCYFNKKHLCCLEHSEMWRGETCTRNLPWLPSSRSGDASLSVPLCPPGTQMRSWEVEERSLNLGPEAGEGDPP